MSVVHINTGGGAHYRRDTILGCSVCGIEDAPILRHVPGSPYYADDYTCTVCGDSWSEGYIGERPFLRGWRQRAIDRAVALWEAACDCPINRDSEGYVLPCKHEETTP